MQPHRRQNSSHCRQDLALLLGLVRQKLLRAKEVELGTTL